MTPAGARRLETWLVSLIAVHSLVVGALLLSATEWSVALGGWEAARPPFFARQAGVFHLVVAICYLVEYRRYRGVLFLLVAKSAACVFLLAETVSASAPWAVPASAVGDLLMLLVVLVVHRRTGGGSTADLTAPTTSGLAQQPDSPTART